MSGTRSLPIRADLLPGEAIDSWLEALAARSSVAFGDLLDAVGLRAPNEQSTRQWVNCLTELQLDALSDATGVARHRLLAATVSQYWGIAIPVDSESGRPSRVPAWWRMSGSRFCPTCLEESGGRWPLAWRLGWTFACTKHLCLLADSCPHCGSVPRNRRHLDSTIPNLNRCSHRASKASLDSASLCLTDLTGAEVPLLAAGHPALDAQRIVSEIIESDGFTFGVYRSQPEPPISILMDVYAVARRALNRSKAEELASIIPQDLLALYANGGDLRYHKQDASAVVAAVGVVAAMHVLNRPDIAAAADSLRWLIPSERKSGLKLRLWGSGLKRAPSDVLRAIQLTAQSHVLNAPEQLRNRLGSVTPGHPRLTQDATDALALRVPTMFWQAWSIRLVIPDHQPWLMRQALSPAVLLVDSRVSVDYAVRAVASPLAEATVLRALRLLRKSRRWPGIRTALTNAASYIANNNVPIDYGRRRQLDYTKLLPDETWARICRNAGVFGARTSRARVVRCFLFERLSGLPAERAPFALNDGAFRSRVADFPRHLTVDVLRALEDHSLEFLARQGIRDEPTTWHPPTHLMSGLDLPGADSDAFDPATLHEMAKDNTVRLSDGAALLGIDIETARYLLAMNPAPASAWLDGVEERPSQLGAYCLAKANLSPDRFKDLYHEEGMSLREIAASAGVCKHTLRKIASEYGLKLRPPIPAARQVVERDWLYDEYVNKFRTIADIAEGIGMNPSTLMDWAKKHDIPRRGHGIDQRKAVLAARAAASAAPRILRPALAAIGGWRRLQRFVAVADYPSLTDAAGKLHLRQDVLTKQIAQLEADLAMKLLIRAKGSQPMRLTPDGEKVLRAVRAYENSGNGN
ncbi:MAG: TniQ family protein [Fimbriimonadaceae bacterium]|nr:TniQ family protein [Fimbriimonadaceae bacterium]